ncbi:MAG TPA: YceI family protein [Acidimicrobiales bacterium]|nr:YceI family protein [Acidimicrobiales bacterium]
MTSTLTTTTEMTREVDGLTLPTAGTFALDKSHSQVGFLVRHLMVSKVRGRFTDFEGALVVTDDPAESSVEVTIQAGSINTNDENRDNHVRTNDFLSVEEFPTLTFRSTKVDLASSGDWKVTGDLTVRGVTRPIVLDVEFEGLIQDPWGNQRLGFTASAEINRDDFGVSFNAALETGGFVIGSKVKLEIEAEAVRQA